MARQLVITVVGTPASQGSKTPTRNGGMRESSAKVRPWREAIRHEAVQAQAKRGMWEPFTGAVVVRIVFTLNRPRNHYGTGRNAHQLKPDAPTAPAVRPDLDKLVRATLDGLTDSGVFIDDAQVAYLSAVKTYPAGDLDALDTPGAVIVVAGVP